MRRNLYKCPNGCKLPCRVKAIHENRDHTYSFSYDDFPFCPICGSLMPISLERLKGFFEVYNIHPLLQNSVDLFYKSEFESAAREAFVTVENVLRDKSKLESHGFDLATKALSFECDKKTGEVSVSVRLHTIISYSRVSINVSLTALITHAEGALGL